MSGQLSLSKSASAAPPDVGVVGGRPKWAVLSANSPAQVHVERVVLVVEAGDDQVGPAVAVDVLGIDPMPEWACLLPVEGGARRFGRVLEGAVPC